jgi:hypothetical protein
MYASDKQVSYAASLLDKAGYGSKWMSARFKELGASMRERSGTVEGWLRGMTKGEISKLIDTLKSLTKRNWCLNNINFLLGQESGIEFSACQLRWLL